MKRQGHRSRQHTLTTHPIRVLQINANRSGAVMAEAFNSAVGNYDIILFQEPWWGHLASGEEGSLNQEGWTVLPPVLPIPVGTAPRVLTYFHRRGDFTVSVRMDMARDLDLQFLEVCQGKFPPTLIVNLYNQQSADSDQWSVDRLMEIRLPPSVPVILTGDWNLHHELWEILERPADLRANHVVEWLQNNDFTLLNSHNEHTYVSHDDAHSHSVLDLTFVNSSAMAVDTVKAWGIRTELVTTSDHKAITFTMDNGAVPVDNVYGVKFNWKSADQEVHNKVLREELDKRDQAFLPLRRGHRRGTHVSHQQLETAAEALRDALSIACEASVPLRRPSSQAKPWWTPELTTLHDALVQLRHRQSAMIRLGERIPEDESQRTRTQVNSFKRAVKKAKRMFFDKIIRETDTRNIWERHRWTKGQRQYPSPPIQRGNNLPDAVQHGDKCDAIRNVLFQEPRDLGVESPDLSSTLVDELVCPPVSRQEVHDAIFGAAPLKAPGPTGSPNLALRWAWEVAEEEVVLLMAECAFSGYHPHIWRHSITAAIRKPNKPDYSKPRAYRPIALLEEAGKVLERIQARRLAYLAAKFNLTPYNQFGGSAGKSTTDAALCFVHDCDVAARKNLATSALAFDITGFFDFVNHAKLLCVLREKRVSTPLIQWTSCFLSERKTAMCLDGIVSDMKPVCMGVPQGSPISPILANIYTSSLCEEFAQAAPGFCAGLEDDTPCLPNVMLYVDDGKIYVSSQSLHTNITILERAYAFCEQWAERFGLLFDLDKRELMHHTRRTRDADLAPHITLPGPNGTLVPLQPLPVSKWLGIYWDTKLRFHEHIRQAAAKASKAVTAMRLLGNTVRGLRPLLFRHLHITVIIPIMTYASPVWFTGRPGQKEILHKLEVVQNQSLRLGLAAFKTTPVRALQVEASVLPITQRLELQMAQAALRFNRLHSAHPVLQRLAPAWRNGVPPIPAPPLAYRPRLVKKQTRLQFIASKSNPKYERAIPFLFPPWDTTLSGLTVQTHNVGHEKADVAEDHIRYSQSLRSNPRHLMVYSDGSKSDHGVGAGVAGFYMGRQVFAKSFGLGTQAEVYDGEVLALAEGAALATSFINSQADFDDITSPITHIHFFTDNSSVLYAIHKPGSCVASQSSVIGFLKQVTSFLGASNTRRVSAEWIPGHHNIYGNDVADNLAKAGTRFPSSLPWEATVSFRHRVMKEEVLERWKTLWRANPIGHRSLYHPADRFLPSLLPSWQMRHLPRQLFGLVLQCRSGHAFVGEYYERHNIDEPTDCLCGAEFQTREHILQECPRYDNWRHILLEQSPTLSLTALLGTEEGIKALATFIARTGAFTKTGDLSQQSEEMPLWPDLDDSAP
jgi:ribonuclease HI